MSRVRRKNKQSRGGGAGDPSSKRAKKTINLAYQDDEHLDSEVEEEEHYQEPSLEEEDESEEETVDAKKVRIARAYLEKIEAADSDDTSSSGDGDDDDDDDEEFDDHDRVGLKLQRDRLKREGTLEREVAMRVDKNLTSISDNLRKGEIEVLTAEQECKQWISSGQVRLLRGHDLTPTCVAMQSNGQRAISGSKDHSVIVWDIEKSTRAVTLCESWQQQRRAKVGGVDKESRNKGEVLSVACSDDGNYVAVGKRDATVCIYDVRVSKQNLVKTFTGHKGPITSLAFRTKSLQLFSGSDDRCIRHYNLSEMVYLETFYGHQFGVSGIDCYRKERPVSVGRDRTARVWKLSEDTHLIFRGGAKVSSADCVSAIKDDWFLTGHDDGHLNLWMSEKKKAVATVESAHGMNGDVGRGIVSLASLRGSDLAATGSSDGYLRLWKIQTGQTLDSRGMKALNKIPLNGFVNGIAFGPKARFCVVAVGQEPRLGRWDRVPKAKNRFGIISLRSSDGDSSSDEDDSVAEGVDQSDDGSSDE